MWKISIKWNILEGQHWMDEIISAQCRKPTFNGYYHIHSMWTYQWMSFEGDFSHWFDDLFGTVRLVAHKIVHQNEVPTYSYKAVEQKIFVKYWYLLCNLVMLHPQPMDFFRLNYFGCEGAIVDMHVNSIIKAQMIQSEEVHRLWMHCN